MDYIALLRQMVSDYLLIFAFGPLTLFCMVVVFGFYQVYLHSYSLYRFCRSAIREILNFYRNVLAD